MCNRLSPNYLQNWDLALQYQLVFVKATALIASLFLFISLYAQQPSKMGTTGKITGRVLDSASGAALDYATVTLQQRESQKTVTGATTEKSGRFVLQDVPAGHYILMAEFIGYKPFSRTNIVVDKTALSIDVKNIYLAKKGTVLKAVTVTAGAKLIENKIDKLVYNAERDITAQSGSATDLLKKVPQVSVDIDGNVELSGSQGVRFLINGKPSAAFGSSVADVLQAIPASQIKSIEVVTNPGARYDAQGMGGIINIILKKNTAQGVNGNLSLAAGTRAENGSFNFNARKGTFGINAFVSGNYRPALNTLSTTDRTSTDTAAKQIALLHQDGISRFNRYGVEAGVGFDWTCKKSHHFTGSVSYDLFGNRGHASIDQWQQLRQQDGLTPIQQIYSMSYTNSTLYLPTMEASLGYKKTYKEDQELEISITNSRDWSHTTADNYQISLPAKNRFYGNRSDNPGTENELEIEADYTQPLKEDWELGAGAKFSSVDISGVADVSSYRANTQDYVPDLFLSNRLNYHQKVYAVYSELSLPVAELFNIKLGGRYERTEINAFFSNAQRQAGLPGYNTFVPSVFLSREMGEKQLLKLSYSKRIERPDYGDLNPFINTSDPKNLVSGNPYLLPEIGHRIELGYNRELGKAGSLTAMLFYRINDQDIQPFIRYYPVYKVGDSTYTNVAVTIRQNIGIERNAGANLSGDLHPGSKLSVRTNLFFFHRYTTNTQDKGYNTTSFNYRFNINAAYQLSGTLVAEFFGSFNSARHEAQGRYPSFTSYSMACRKQFWNKKGSVALTAANPFSNYVLQRTDLFGPNFTIRNRRQVPLRSFGINFTWKFGRLEFKEKEEQENPAAPIDSQQAPGT